MKNPQKSRARSVALDGAGGGKCEVLEARAQAGSTLWLLYRAQAGGGQGIVAAGNRYGVKHAGDREM